MNRDVEIREIYDHLQSDELIETLKRIVNFVSSNNAFDWNCRQKGFLYDIRFFHRDDSNLFRYAIVPAQNWLLWYFRKPALERFSYDIAKLEREFSHHNDNGKVNINKKDEITIRLFTPSDAHRLIDKYFK